MPGDYETLPYNPSCIFISNGATVVFRENMRDLPGIHKDLNLTQWPAAKLRMHFDYKNLTIKLNIHFGRTLVKLWGLYNNKPEIY